MLKLSDLERKQFMICGVMMQKVSNGILIEIPEDPFIFINGPGRKQVSDPNGNLAKDGLYRWAAGGSIQILKQGEKEYIALILKDSGAPSYGGHLTIASGLSDSYDNFFNPTRIALKEGIEEVAILVDGNHIVPVLMQEYEELFWSIYNHQKSRLEKFGFDTNQSQSLVYARSTLLATSNDEILEIRCGYRSVQHVGVINIDANTRGIDLLKMIKTEIPDGEVSFLDCEDTKNGPLDREIVMFELSNITIDNSGNTMRISGASRVFKSGVPAPVDFERKYPLTPVTKTILEAIRV